MTTVSGCNIKDKFIAVLPDIYSAFQNDPDNIFSMRLDALERLKTIMAPTRKDEDWKYTSLSRLPDQFSALPHPVPPPEIFAEKATPGSPGITARLVNGLRLSLSEPSGNIFFNSLNNGWKKNNVPLNRWFGKISRWENSFFGLLNTAGWSNGILMSVPDNMNLREQVRVSIVTTEEKIIAQPRLFFHAGKNACADVFVFFSSHDGKNSLTNCLAETVIEEEGKLNLYLISDTGGFDEMLFSNTVHQADGSKFRQVNINLNGEWSRFETRVLVAGQWCSTELFGLFIPSDGQFMDHHTRIDHLVPLSESNELYKGVILEKGKAVFNGKVYVHPGAQKTSAYQSNKNLLLSDDGAVYSKPELEIYADDVKCSHGSATGYLNDEVLFYLRSRGISGEKAKKMLVTAFAGEIISKIPDEDLRIGLEKIIDSKL